MADEIMREVWRVKDALAHEHGGEVAALAEHLRKRVRPSGQAIVNPEKRGAGAKAE